MIKKTQKYILIIVALLLSSVSVMGQNMSINKDGSIPDNSAMLDVSDTTSGLLIPRMTSAQRINIASPANGLMVVQTDGNEGFYIYSSNLNAWTRVMVDSTLSIAAVLEANNNANNDTLVNLGALSVGIDRTPSSSVEIDSFLTIQGAAFSNFRWYGYNTYVDNGGNLRYLNNGQAGLTGFGSENMILGHWQSGSKDALIANDASTSISLSNKTIELTGDSSNFEINLDGKVGVNIGSPSSPLHVSASTTANTFETNGIYLLNEIDSDASQHAFITARTQENGGSPYFSLDINNQIGYSLGISQSTSTLDFYPSADGSGTPVMSLNTTNVGIGTTNPQENLHINSATSAGILIEADTGDIDEAQNPFISLRQDGGTVQGTMGFEGAANTLFTNSLEDAMYVGTNTSTPLQFYTSNTARMTLEGDGDVGIGLSAPTQRLDVAVSGTDGIRITGDNTGDARYSITNGGGTHYIFDDQSNANSFAIESATELKFSTNGNTERMRITSAGNVGIGTSSPNAPLQFANTTANRKLVLFESTNNDHQFYGMGVNSSVLRYQTSSTSADHVFYSGASSTSSNELMRIEGTGNVGIGINSPNYRLDVNGTFSANSINVNDNYTFPTDAPTSGEILKFNGSNLVWDADDNSQDGNGIYSGSGSLSSATTSLTFANNSLDYNLSGSGDFTLQDNGTDIFQVRDDGVTQFGDDVYWRDGSISGTILMQLTDDGDDARLILNENGSTAIDLDANSGFIFNEQGNDRDFRVESNSNANMIFVDAGSNEVGIGTSSPGATLDVNGTAEFTGDVEFSGEVHTVSTSAFNMLPIAMVNVDASGSIRSSTGNVTVNSLGTGLYQVTVSSHTASFNNDIVSINLNGSSAGSSTYGTLSGSYVIYTYDSSGSFASRGFNLVIYSP